jgi:hypothetical protein
MLFSKRQIFDGSSKIAASEFEEFVDPDPTHTSGSPR